MKKTPCTRFCVEMSEAIQKHCDDAMVEVTGTGLSKARSGSLAKRNPDPGCRFLGWEKAGGDLRAKRKRCEVDEAEAKHKAVGKIPWTALRPVLECIGLQAHREPPSAPSVQQ